MTFHFQGISSHNDQQADPIKTTNVLAPIRSGGFTLLELLLALTLVALIVVLAYGSLRMGIRAWEKGEQGTGQKERIVLQLLRRQVSSILIPNQVYTSEIPPPLVGENDSLAFTSQKSLVPENSQGAVFVQYAVKYQQDWMDLLFWEKPIAFIKENDTGNTEIDDMQELLHGMYAISFSFLQLPKNNEDEYVWHTHWPPEGEIGLPLAIKISLQEHEGSPIDSVIVPLHLSVEEQKK